MKRENAKKSKLGLIIAICLIAVLAVGGVLLAVLGFGSGQQGAATGPVKLYWNVDRDLYWGKSATGFSSREPGADGVYRIKFAVDGQQVEIPVVDKTLVNAIDSMEVMVLTLDNDGNVIDVQEAKNVVKHSVIKSYVQDVSGDTINANSVILMNGMRHRIKVTEKTKIYDMSGDAEFIGQEVKAETLSFLDCIHMFVNEATEEQTVFVLSHMEERKLYFRAEQKWDFAEEGTLRQPDADGVYILEVFHEGQLVELKTKDKDIADLFDYKSPYSPHFCFDFDDDGYIISIENSEVGKFGLLTAQRVEVLEIDGNKIMAMETIQGSQGRAYNLMIPDDCAIYDASNVAKVEGRQGKEVDSLKLRDIINVWTDVNGTPKFIYIAQRMADSPAYWTFSQKYDNTKQETTRTPVKGWYEFELAEAGKGGTKIYKTKNKALANQIDATKERVVGLKLNGNIIEGVYAPEDLYGYSIIGRGSAVRDINSIFVNLIGFAAPDNPTQVMMGESCKVYDVSGVGKVGTETELQVGDHVYSFRDLTGQVVAIFVTQRSLGGNTLYYNLDYQYDSATGETKRQPNEKGYYEFLMAHKGKQVTVKTKDKAIANKIDAVGSLMMSLIIKNGVVTNVFTGDWAYNQIISSAHEVKKVNSDGSLLLAYGENEITVKPTKNTSIYNVSYVYDKYRGEKTTKFKVGDMLGVIADMYGEPQVIYVRHRMVDHMYYRMTAMLDEDGDGWYTGQFLCDGKVLTLRTQDKTIVQQINDYAAPMGLALKGDVIRGYLVPTQVKGVPYAGYNSWDVSKVDGRKVTVTYRIPGHEYTGVSEKLTLAKNCKIYDVSPTAEKFGAETTLKPGDRIRGYMDKDKNHAIIYITYRANRAAGMESVCDHCGKKVYWNPWDGGTFKQVDGHYYLNTDVTVQSQAVVGGKDIKEYEIVLDLNGKTITSENARAFLVYYGSTLTIMDSVGTGAMEATGITGGHGGVGLVSSGTLNLLGGTLRHISSEQVVTSAGGLMVENSTFNMYGGIVEGGNAQKGELSDGLGGNIYGHNGVINLYGGTIRGGKATTYGGNIYSYNTIFNMYGGRVENGEAGTYGGNLFCANITENNFYGGVMTGGKTNGRDGNMYIYNDQAKILLGDVTIDGDMYVGQAPITVNGKPVIKKGAVDGLTLLSGAKLIVQKMKAGTELYINANGVISDPTDQAAKIVEAGYIKPVVNGMVVSHEDGVLVMKERTILADCEHCQKQQVEWKLWTGSNSRPASGHYFLGEDLTGTTQTNIAADVDVVLDLKGYDITVNGNRAFAVLGGGNLTVMDSVGNGVVSATGFTGGHGGVAMVDGNLTLLGGTLKMIESDAVICNGGVLIFSAGTTFDMRGGVIEGGKAQTGDLSDGLGGNIYATNATLNISGGIIRGGNADYVGGNIAMEGKNGKLNVSGSAVIENGVAQAGGNMSLFTATTLNMTGGTVRGGQSNYTNATFGGGGNIFAVSANVNVSAGTVANGTAPTLQGGNIFVRSTDAVLNLSGTAKVSGGSSKYDGGSVVVFQNAVMNMAGGTVESGEAGRNGGNIVVEGATLNVTGGTISGGKATASGGNIYSYNSTINMHGGSLTNGEANTYGGNLFCANVTTSNFYGGIITGGKTSGNDGNIYIYNDQASVLLGDCTIDGGVYIGQATIAVNGKPVIKKDIANGLTLLGGAKLNIQDMKAGTELYINAVGAISDPTDKAEEIITAGYIKPVLDNMTVGQEQGALVIEEQKVLADCAHCQQLAEWKVWTGESKPASGHYYLISDIISDYQTTIAAGTDVVLDLKGYDITVNGSRAFLVQGELTIMDSEGDGIVSATGFTGGHGGVASVDGKLTLRGGTLKMIESEAVICNGGTLILGAPTAVLDIYDGVIVGGHAQKGDLSNGLGGNIYCYGATINMYGGTITGGRATTYGGNIYCANASKVNLYGGTITGGQTNGNDGNIFILNDQATFLLGDVTLDGGVYVGQATITINGKPVIKKDTANGLTLDYGAKLDIQDMKAGTELYINASGVISNTTDKADEIIAAGYIKPVRNDQMVTNNGGALNVGPLPNCDHCNQYVSWEAWDGTGNLATGHYYLTGDITRETQITIPGDNNVVLDLKGFDITATASRAFLVVGNLTIMDTVGDGVISATGVTGGHGGVAMVDGNLTLLGGTLKMIESDAVICNGGVLIFSAGTTFDMRGGVIEGGKAQKGDLSDGMGGNIYATNATLKISGGVIRGGSADYVGGNIAMEGSSCTLSVSDNAVIEGGIAQAGGNVSLFTATTLNMTGGIIRGGQSNYSNATFGGGGNIFAASATVNISAGTVQNGTAPTLQGGNIFMRYADAVLNLSGTGKISGGSCRWDGGSIVIFQNAVMNMTGGTVENGEAGRNGGNIIVESATANISGGTISGGKAAGHGGNIVALGVVNLQGGTVTGGVVDNTTGSFGGNIYAEGTTGAANTGIVNISGDAAITDGKAPAGGNIGTYKGTITMTGGTVSGGESTYATGDYGGGGNMYLLSATANISGGTVTGGKAPTLEGGNIYVRGSNCVLTVSGTAAITGGESRYDGGNILVFQWATLNVQGGTISGGTAGRNHPCVFVSTYSYANFSGGNVEAVYVVNNAAGLSVSGNAVIGNMDLTDGALVSIGEMATGAEVKITAADGRFSAVSANATTYADCFKAAVAGKKVYPQDNALYMGDE